MPNIPDENDSLDDNDDYPMSPSQVIAHGLEIGATHAFFWMDIDGTTGGDYAMPGQCSGTIEKAISRAAFSVETYDLDDIRKQESEQ